MNQVTLVKDLRAQLVVKDAEIDRLETRIRDLEDGLREVRQVERRLLYGGI